MEQVKTIGLTKKAYTILVAASKFTLEVNLKLKVTGQRTKRPDLLWQVF
jgi:hypothetical protein